MVKMLVKIFPKIFLCHLHHFICEDNSGLGWIGKCHWTLKSGVWLKNDAYSAYKKFGRTCIHVESWELEKKKKGIETCYGVGLDRSRRGCQAGSIFFKIPDANMIKDLVILSLIKMLHSKQINRKELLSNHKTKGKNTELTKWRIFSICFLLVFTCHLMPW